MQPQEVTDYGSGGRGERMYLASDIHSVLQNEEVFKFSGWMGYYKYPACKWTETNANQVH